MNVRTLYVSKSDSRISIGTTKSLTAQLSVPIPEDVRAFADLRFGQKVTWTVLQDDQGNIIVAFIKPR